MHYINLLFTYLRTFVHCLESVAYYSSEMDIKKERNFIHHEYKLIYSSRQSVITHG